MRFVNSILSLIKVLLLSKKRNILKIQATDKVETCVILGNGPSFNQTFETYKDILKNMNLMAVNNFASSNQFEFLQPNFYIVNAPIFFKPESELSELYINGRNEIFENIVSKTNWKMYVFVPFIAKNSVYFKSVLQRNQNLIPLYYNTTPVEGLKWLNHLLFNFGFGMPRPHNVIIPAIMNLIKIDTKNIYIVGADHSWLAEISVNDKNEALVNQKHFYDEKESKPQKMEDFIKRPRRLHEILHKFYLSFKGYWEIKNYAEAKKVKIYNASEISMIDAFERKKLNQI